MRWLLILFLVASLPGASWAQDKGFTVAKKSTLSKGSSLPKPVGPKILTVYAQKLKGEGEAIILDRAAMEAMGTIRYTSKNRWYPQPVTYEGVLGEVFLQWVGIPKGAKELSLRALNDYVVRIPLEDFLKWPVMLAMKLDGIYMSVRDKGPIWIVYPNHLHPVLGTWPYNSRWIWQLKEISFE